MNQEDKKLKGDLILNIKVNIPSINDFNKEDQIFMREVFSNS